MRNTPAEAGKTQRFAAAHFDLKKHPRRGGEDGESRRQKQTCQETPPPRRGRRRVAVLGRKGQGNTPAEAGKTNRVRGNGRSHWKHPRRGGED